ncbi:MAG: hypothetical protein C0618_03240 [Desulfuromonas sp.]|nr:MAG: hypothetical protein C0618_03240 [Desulfuromonas sp.]
MRCPKCGYNSFDHLENCKKCGRDLSEHRTKFGIKNIFLAGISLKAAAEVADKPLADLPEIVETETPLHELPETQQAPEPPPAKEADDFGFDFMEEDSTGGSPDFDDLFEETSPDESPETQVPPSENTPPPTPLAMEEDDISSISLDVSEDFSTDFELDSFDLPEPDEISFDQDDNDATEFISDDDDLDLSGFDEDMDKLAEPPKGTEEDPARPFDQPETREHSESPATEYLNFTFSTEAEPSIEIEPEPAPALDPEPQVIPTPAPDPDKNRARAFFNFPPSAPTNEESVEEPTDGSFAATRTDNEQPDENVAFSNPSAPEYEAEGLEIPDPTPAPPDDSVDTVQPEESHPAPSSVAFTEQPIEEIIPLALDNVMPASETKRDEPEPARIEDTDEPETPPVDITEESPEEPSLEREDELEQSAPPVQANDDADTAAGPAKPTTAQPPSFSRRLTAFFCDIGLLGLIGCGFILIAETVLADGDNGMLPSLDTLIDLSIPYFLVIFCLTFGYFTLFHFLSGQTPGKMLTAIRVETSDGEAISFSQAFIRSVGGLIQIIPLGLGYLSILLNHAGQGWNDQLAGTRVASTDSNED